MLSAAPDVRETEWLSVSSRFRFASLRHRDQAARSALLVIWDSLHRSSPGQPRDYLVWSRNSTGLKRRGLQPRLVSSDCLLHRLDKANNPASPYSIIALLVSGELRLPVFTPRLRHPACPPCKVRELPELRGSPGGMTSAIGCTEFSLGTVILGLIAVVVQRFLSAASQSAVAPGCEIPTDARLCEMAREFLLSRSPRSFRNPASCRKQSPSLRCSPPCSAAFRSSSGWPSPS